jgi:hypothetical protein
LHARLHSSALIQLLHYHLPGHLTSPQTLVTFVSYLSPSTTLSI